MPMRAAGVGAGHFGECLFRLVVPERVQQRDAALERLLDRGRAGHREMHQAEIVTLSMLIVSH